MQFSVAQSFSKPQNYIVLVLLFSSHPKSYQQVSLHSLNAFLDRGLSIKSNSHRELQSHGRFLGFSFFPPISSASFQKEEKRRCQRCPPAGTEETTTLCERFRDHTPLFGDPWGEFVLINGFHDHTSPSDHSEFSNIHTFTISQMKS